MKKFLFFASIFLFALCRHISAQSQNNSPAEIQWKSQPIVIIAGIILVLWLALVAVYLVWAIHRYGTNYGLTNKEWKILYPRIYASDNDVAKYSQLRDEIVKSRQLEAVRKADGGQWEIITTPFKEPEENPYKCDSFGLPPNSIRGIIALTALILFVLMEGINYFSGIKLEDNFSGLIVALQMVIAFYFGSRAIEVLSTRARKQKEEEKPEAPEAEMKKPSEEKAPMEKTMPVVQETVQPVDVHKQIEQPILPVDKTSFRITSQLLNSHPEVISKATMEKFKNGEGIHKRDLPERILALTGSFETGENFPKCFAGLTGNFDGQGISFGVLQWNFGQGSLPPLLQKMNIYYKDICGEILGDLYFDFERMLGMTRSEQLAWSKSIQYTHAINGRTHWHIDPKWIKVFVNLGLTVEMIKIQADAASTVYCKALALASEYGLTTERGAALMFDIVTQNGILDKSGTGSRIKEDYLNIPSSLSPEDQQVEKMKIIAKRRAEVCRPAFVQDVLDRKLAIAKGEGTVHSKVYNLKDEFNITLAPVSIISPVQPGVIA